VLGALFSVQASAEPPSGAGKADAPGQAKKAEGTPGAQGQGADKRDIKAEAKTEQAGTKADTAAGKADLSGKPADPGAQGQGAEKRAERATFRSQLRELSEELKAGKVKKDEVKARLDKLSETRKERHQQHREALKERWGDKLTNSAAISELRHHERRMAMLDRALVLAQTDATVKNKDKTIQRIEQLIEKENQRHERKMGEFKSASPAGTNPSTVGASAPGQPGQTPGTVPAQAPAAPAGGEK